MTVTISEVLPVSPLGMPTSLPEALAALLGQPVAVSSTVGVLLPLVVALLSTRAQSPGFRGSLLLLTSAVTSFLTDLVHVAATAPGAGIAVDWRTVLIGAVSTWVTGHVAHASLWRRTALARRLLDLFSPPSPAVEKPATKPQPAVDAAPAWEAAAMIARERPADAEPAVSGLARHALRPEDGSAPDLGPRPGRAGAHRAGERARAPGPP